MMLFFIAEDGPKSVSMIFLISTLAMLMFMLVILLAVAFFYVRPWLRAFSAATPISIFQIIMMRFRGSPVNEILKTGIAANQAGHRIAWEDLERAAIEGADLSMITDAYCILRERGEHYSIDELVSAYKESRLKDLLN